jgi:hypothetical protein
VLDGLRHLLGVDVGGELGQDEEAAGREGGHVAADEIVDAVVLLGDEVGEGDQRQRDGLGEVEDRLRLPEDLLRLADIGLQIVGGALRGAAQQGLGVPQHDRVVVRVDHTRLRGHRLGDLVEVGLGGDARADVEELADAVLGEQPGRPVHEAPVGLGGGLHIGVDGQDALAQLLVDRVVVLAAQPPVVDARRVRLAGVDRGHAGLRRLSAG